MRHRPCGLAKVSSSVAFDSQALHSEDERCLAELQKTREAYRRPQHGRNALVHPPP